ncbi:hypothetical protein HELRODRAFT_172887 [Helobdella robusta]|uniref:Alpha-macroglobulin receptor-binding domain-containing protein n=1 Tax=Helobdella robusta TaxID=6412 RepID=T1F627_HELRO|nr:hypothetical protein HELRODRAFT_172887 [Helobdella robusta]ESO03863.1 hypothetical protein HELRODRAFT_172887 [Helobdella robusta]
MEEVKAHVASRFALHISHFSRELINLSLAYFYYKKQPSSDILDGAVKILWHALTGRERELVQCDNDPYVLGVVAYAFYCVGSHKLDHVLDALYKFALIDDEKTHWKQPMPHDQEEDAWLLKEFASPYDIELTSYVLLLRASQKNLNLSLPIARWLIGQMSGIGGFVSTQDTVLALEALTKFAPLVSFVEKSKGTKIKISGDVSGDVHKLPVVNKNNLLQLQTVQLNELTRRINVSAEGDGFILLQMTNLRNTCSWMGNETSGMVIVEIDIPTGFLLKDPEEYKRKLQSSVFPKVEFTPQKIVVYLAELYSASTEFRTTLEQVLSVHSVKPALVQVYRYYQPRFEIFILTDERVSEFYSPLEKKSWVSTCPQCSIAQENIVRKSQDKMIF